MRELTIKGYIFLGLGIIFLEVTKIFLAICCFSIAAIMFIQELIRQFKGK